MKQLVQRDGEFHYCLCARFYLMTTLFLFLEYYPKTNGNNNQQKNIFDYIIQKDFIREDFLKEGSVI